MVKNVCRNEKPPLVSVEEEHLAACHFSADVQAKNKPAAE
jgi:hypothetical protein